jgi:hypothetical protein
VLSSKKRDHVDGEAPEEFVDDEEHPESTVSYWVVFKLWVLKHEHKWGAIAYAVFLLVFTLVVLKSQVLLPVSVVTRNSVVH